MQARLFDFLCHGMTLHQAAAIERIDVRLGALNYSMVSRFLLTKMSLRLQFGR